MRLDINFYKVKGRVTREDLKIYYSLRDLRDRVKNQVEGEEGRYLVDLKGEEALGLVNKIISRINSKITSEERKFLVHKKILIDNAIIVGYFRRHIELNSYIEENFVHLEDFNDGNFNRKYLVLTREDLEDILEFSKGKLLEIKEGKFREGETRVSSLDDWIETIEFLEKILLEVDFEAESILYDCWF